MRKWLSVLAVVALAFLAPACGDSSGYPELSLGNEGSECSVHSECHPEHKYCVSGYCQGPAVETSYSTAEEDFSGEDITSPEAEDDTSAGSEDSAGVDECPAGYEYSGGQCLALAEPVGCSVDSDCTGSCQCNEKSQTLCAERVCVEGTCEVSQVIVYPCPYGCAAGECLEGAPEEDIKSSGAEDGAATESDVAAEPDTSVIEADVSEEDVSAEGEDTSAEEDVAATEVDVAAETDASVIETDVSEEEVPPEEEVIPPGEKVFACRFATACSLPVAVIWYGLNWEEKVECGANTEEVFEATLEALCLWGTTNPTFKYNLTDEVYQWGGGNLVVPDCGEDEIVIVPDAQQGAFGKMVVSFPEAKCF